MAIHVRPTNTVKLKIAAIVRRILLTALCLAFLVMSIPTLYMYIVKIYQLKAPQSSFTTYTPPAPKKRPVQRQQREEVAAVESSAASPPMPMITSPVSPYVMDIPAGTGDIGEGLTGEASFGDGFGLVGFGDGIGDGGGGGIADSNGDDRGSGRRAGYNDDIQVVLILDASGSMDALFKAVASSLEQVVTTLSNAKLNGKKTKVNVGIVVLGQNERNGSPYKLTPFTTRTKQMKSKLEEVQCTGALEPYGEAISFAVHNYRWNRRERDDMLKVIFLAGDEDLNQGSVDYHTAIAAATEQNIIVNTIHCNSYPDENWEEAAEIGNGVATTMDIRNTATQEADPEELYKVLMALHNCAPKPIGSPAVQKKHIQMLNKASAPPHGKLDKLLKWALENRQRIITGYEWDAIEVYRRCPEGKFSIDMLGGEGNLPVELRGKSEEEIVGILSAAAARRNQLLDKYNSLRNAGDLGTKLLSILREQAQEKGITIEF